MEDVLDLYEEDYDPRHPKVCFDEKLVAPEADVRPAEPLKPGQPERIDYEYERLGTANLFFFVEPLMERIKTKNWQLKHQSTKTSVYTAITALASGNHRRRGA